MPTPEQLQEWHTAFSRIERVDDYNKLKKHLNSVKFQIETLTDDIDGFLSPRNDREKTIQCHERGKLQMLIKQQERLKEKLAAMAKQIESDIKESKNE